MSCRRMGSVKLLMLKWLLLIVAVSVAGCAPRDKDKLIKEPEVTLYVHENGTKKTVKLEDYLPGVVAAEMEPSWPIEALSAQAILARTYTMEKISRGGVRELHGTDVCTSADHFQAYDESKINDRVREAVRRTRGKVVTYKGRYVRAWFHACSGGKTATPKEGLGFSDEPVPYLKPVKDVSCPNEEMLWESSFDEGTVRQSLSRLGVNVSNISSVKIGRRGPSGRSITLEFNGEAVDAVQLRKELGSDKMRSTLLEEVRVDGDKVVMKGKGWGHGVGMSQWGAYRMAKDGKRAEDIINYYFTGVKVEKKW